MKMENKSYKAEVVWFSIKKGFGFLSWEIDGVKQKDMFIHFSDIAMQGFKTIDAGQKVSFEIGSNKNGDPKAINVQILKD
jgi:cold shock protein